MDQLLEEKIATFVMDRGYNSTFMTLKIEKQNGLFHVVIEWARGIKAKDQIKMFLYRFSTGMKAILEKDAYGIQHIKYKERPKSPRQLQFEL